MGQIRGQGRTDNTQRRSKCIGSKRLSRSLTFFLVSLFILFLLPGSATAATKWVDVAAGMQHGLAVKEDGSLWAWGRNHSGMHGNGGTVETRSPVRIGASNLWSQVDAAWYQSAGLQSNGSAYTWGQGDYGKLGNGVETDSLSPFQIVIGAETFQDIATGQNHTSVVTNTGKLYSMGYNTQGAIAQGSYTPDRYLTPTRESTSGTDWFGVGSGNGAMHLMGLKNSGVLWGWGNNWTGQLGVGSIGNYKNVVTRAKTPSTCPNLDGTGTYVDVAAGQWFSVGLRSNGWICVMGDDAQGQLGNGVGEADINQPQRLSTTAYSAIAAGQAHVLAVRGDGTLWSWGYNSKGQLGVGSTANKEVPTQVGTDSDWATVGAGYNMSYGIKTNGSLWAWGENNTNYGYLGLGSFSSYINRPAQIDAISTFASTTPSSGAGSGNWYLSPPTVTLTPDQPGTTQYQWNGTTEDGWTNYSGTFATSEGQNDLKYRSIDGFGVTESANSRKVWVDLNDPTEATDVLSTSHSTTDAIANEYIAVQWTGSTDGVSGIDGYDYSFTKGATDKPDGVKDVEQGVTAITSDALTGGGWYFHVRAMDNAGRKSTTTHSGPFQIRSTFVQVSAGGDSNAYMSHTLGVKDDGSLWAWGLNNNGQLGDGTTTDATRPTQIGSDIDWLEASAGDGFSLGLKTNGEVWAWGRNAYGQLGDGTTSSSLSPVQVIGVGGSGFLTDAVQIAAGSRHALARRTDNTLVAWGANDKGQLGAGDFVDSATPDTVLVTAGNLTSATDIDAGGDHSAAIRSPGSLWTWGYNFYGQLGDSTNSNRNKGVQESHNWTTWTGLAVGRFHTIGRFSNGLVYAFGLNDKGQLGDNTNTDRNIATALSGTGFNAVGVAAGNSHSLVHQSDGSIRSFGLGASGQLGRSSGSTADAKKFVTVGGSMTGFLTSDAGADFSIAIKNDKSLWVWGGNASGQLGDGTLVDKYTPLQVEGDQITTFSSNPSVANGSNGWWVSAPSITLSAAAPGVTYYQLDATADGAWTTYTSSFTAPEGASTIYYRSTDTLNGTTEDINNQGVNVDTVDPTDPSVYSSSHATDDVSYDNTIDVTWDGATDLTSGVDGFSFSYTEGVTELPDAVKDAEETVTSDTSGVLATGDWYFNLRTLDNAGHWTSTVHLGPFTIESPWVQIEVGYRHTLAIKDDGTLWAWGYNRYGQLGDGTVIDSNVPVQVGAATNWTDIAVGIEHSMGLQSTGRLYGWGRNSKGQIGNASTAEQHSPVQVYGSWNTWSEVEAGVRHTIARRGGWLYGWGDNLYGQLGTGGSDSFTHTRPLRESLDYTNWTSIGTGDYTSFGIRSTGHLWGWGRNKEGQLGVGNSGAGTDRSAPTLVRGNYTNWVEVDGGSQHTVGRQSTGKTYAWGKNTYGQVGDNSTTDALVQPIRTNLGPAASDIEVGGNFTLARATDGRIYTWGYNSRGQLGQGDTDTRYGPIQVGADADWSIISAGDQSAIATKTDNSTWVWGYNLFGTLGDGSATDSLSPVLMNGIKTTASLNPSSPDGLNGWYASIPQVTLSTSVPGASKYRWDTDIATWFDYSAPFGADLGQRTLTYYSLDGTADVEDNTDLVIKTDPYRPSPPVLSVTSTASSHDLTWTPASDSESSVAEYRIYDIDGTELVTIDALSYSFTGLTGDATRRYYVKAQDMAGNFSDESATVTGATAGGVDVTSPTAPKIAAFVDDPLTIHLKVGGSQDNVGVVGYKVRDQNSGTFIADFSGGTLTITEDAAGDPLNDSQYYGYLVVAYDAAGNMSPLSNKVRIRPTNGGDGYEETPAGTSEEPVTVMPGKKAEFPKGSPAVTFKDVTQSGETKVKKVLKEQESPQPAGFRLVGGQIDISTTAKFRDKVTVAFRYDEDSITGKEVNLKLLHYHNSKWADITTFVDTRNNIIYGETSEFSHFGFGHALDGTPLIPTGNSTAALFFGILVLVLGVGAVRRMRRAA